MKILAVIPARGGSKRVPRKNIKNFYGKPILSYSIDNAQKSKIFDYVHVSTEDTEIYNIAVTLGCDPLFYRDSLSAADDVPVRDVLREVWRKFGEKGVYFDVICLLSATAPLIDPDDLIKAYNLFIQKDLSHPLLAVAQYPVPIEWALKQDKIEGNLIPVNHDLFFASSHSFEATYYDIGSFAFFSKDHLFTDDSEIEFIPYVVPLLKGVDVDTMEDWHLLEQVYKVVKDR